MPRSSLPSRLAALLDYTGVEHLKGGELQIPRVTSVSPALDDVKIDTNTA